MERTVVISEKAPRSTSPLSLAIKAVDYLFMFEQVGVNPTNPPTRSCVEVKSLPRESLEADIECVAAL